MVTLSISDKLHSIRKTAVYWFPVVCEVFSKYLCSRGLLKRVWLLWRKRGWVLLYCTCQTAVFFQLSNSGRMSQSSSLLTQCALRPSGYSWGQDGRKHIHSQIHTLKHTFVKSSYLNHVLFSHTTSFTHTHPGQGSAVTLDLNLPQFFPWQTQMSSVKRFISCLYRRQAALNPFESN